MRICVSILALTALTLSASALANPSASYMSDYVPLETGPSPLRSPSKPWTKNWVAISCKNTSSSVVLVNHVMGPAPGRTGAGSGRTRGALGKPRVRLQSVAPRGPSCPSEGIQMDQEAATLYASELDSCIRDVVLADLNIAPSTQIYSEAEYPTNLRTKNNDYSNSHPVTDIWQEAPNSCSLHGSGRAVDLFRVHVAGMTYDYEKAWNLGNSTPEWESFWIPLKECMKSFYVITAEMDKKHYNHMHLGLHWPYDGDDHEEWMDRFADG